MKKHILCFGDSNTHGFCADPADCADGGNRFNESERWTCLLQKQLGDGYLVIEEGLGGRTTCFPDPLQEGACGLDYLVPCLGSHEPVDLLIVMLGTNDTKDRFAASAGVSAKLWPVSSRRLRAPHAGPARDRIFWSLRRLPLETAC